ncbi:ParB/RepB/Spo0J family partition protein [Streptomyces venezuelae]|uniref:Plasmid replication/partition related protein n=1 Tax=Streptomyces venezuelae TaxID=54571 RepID=A0A5P2AT46_STRVZ|nr:ParB/RepB/Spo0J family partition protein [Streptomyces venezuelae]QES21285.1 plasmid replication/partition related protein [Streptomyces venezuelae]
MFPMLSQDELLDLAESIKAEGQHRPIVLDADGVLLDGRNRLAACEIAGVEPHFTTYTGSDPTALILSSNVFRRHISKGQEAMITAMACSVSGHSLRDLAKTHGLSRTRLSAANVVLKYSPGLAEQVRIGAFPLDTAYEAARENKAKAEAIQEKHDRVTEHAPDLAKQVAEGHLTLDNAIATLEERQKQTRVRNQIAEADALRIADGHTSPPLAQLAEQGDITWNQAHQQAEQYITQRQTVIHHTQQAIEQAAQRWTTIRTLIPRPDTAFAREVHAGLSAEARELTAHLTPLT